MRIERADFDKVMELLDQVVGRLAAQHTTPHDFDTGVPLHRAEIHTVQAIGKRPGINVTALAEHMGVSKGAVSQTVSRLVKKGLVAKKGAKDNERETLLDLTDLGSVAYRAHEEFHMVMFERVQSYFGEKLPEKIVLFASVLTDLNGLLDSLEE